MILKSDGPANAGSIARHAVPADTAAPLDWQRARASVSVAAASVALSILALKIWPALELDFFCRGAAQLAALLTGSPLVRVEGGWMLPTANPAIVTAACSGTTYFVLLAGLFGWHLHRRTGRTVLVPSIAIASALPTAITVNALRVAAVLQTHRWLNPLLPDAFHPFLHLLTGVAVFLPALIAINLACETHGRINLPSRA